MKYKLIIILIINTCFFSCKNWQVVQELESNKYHIYNVRKKHAEIIETNKKLEIEKLYKKSSLEIIKN